MPTFANNKYYENVKNILQTNTARQLIFMFGVTLSVALGIVLFISIQEPTYRPLDYQINQRNMATIVDTLEKAGINYKISERDGILYVAANDLQLAKLKLSAAGIPKDDSINYSFLNEPGNLGNSHFIENARYLRALENDLAKTISSIEGVSGARVHIAMPQNNIFADESSKTTASVILSISPGFSGDKEKIRSIVQLIAASVPGLDPKNVAITDQYGHYLSGGLDQNSVFNAEQLSYQNNMQNYYEKRIESMIAPILGDNKVTVRVNADIDFTQQENAQEEYDPNKTVVLSENSTSEEDDSSGASGAPGSLSNTPPDESSSGSSSGGGQSGGSTKRSQSTKNYDVSKTVTYKKSNFAKIKGLSVAVVVGNEMVMDAKTKKYVSKPLEQEKINKITDLVKATIGYDQARGDKVTVVNSTFTPVAQDFTVSAGHIWDNPWFWDVIKKIVGISLGFVFLFFVFKRITGTSFVQQAKRKGRTQSESADIQETQNEIHSSKQEKMNQLKQLAATEPNRVANIIKTWVGK